MSDKMDAPIPFVDLDAFNVNRNPEDVDETVQRQLAVDVYDAFSTVGFVCLRNHGIPQNTVSVFIHFHKSRLQCNYSEFASVTSIINMTVFGRLINNGADDSAWRGGGTTYSSEY